MSNTTRFLPAKESGWFIWLFDLYVRWLLKRRFHRVHLDSEYKPGKHQKTIYYLNHSSWWDGLVPFILNQRLFRQKARGMMEDKQLKAYPFFRRLGVFSIPADRRSSQMFASLRYALHSLQRDGSSLYIYPQGKIEPFQTRPIRFKKGLGWLARQCPDADLVPVGIYIHTMRKDKPELHISVGSAVNIGRESDTETINKILEQHLEDLLKKLVNSAADMN
ncbi:MAG: lysophospholipid acyltransferase family protein [Balneolaceae bacterium]